MFQKDVQTEMKEIQSNVMIPPAMKYTFKKTIYLSKTLQE